MIIINYCAECNSPTNSTLFIRQLGFLCGECAMEYGNKEIEKLVNEKNKINKQIQEITSKIKETIQNDCKHKNAFASNYVFIGQDEFEQSWRCPDCGLIFKRPIK